MTTSHRRSWVTAHSGAGLPSASRPSASTRPAPIRATSAGTTIWISTVTSKNTAVTSPAASILAPPETAQDGSEDSVRSKLVKPNRLTISSFRIAGIRHSAACSLGIEHPDLNDVGAQPVQ